MSEREDKLQKKIKNYKEKVTILEEMVESKTREVHARSMEIEQSNQKLDNIFNAIIDMIFIIDKNGVITDINRESLENDQDLFVHPL